MPLPELPPSVLMVAPSGEAAYVPREHKRDYIVLGMQVGVRMTAPTGEKAIVPYSRVAFYRLQGATVDVGPEFAKAYPRLGWLARIFGGVFAEAYEGLKQWQYL